MSERKAAKLMLMPVLAGLALGHGFAAAPAQAQQGGGPVGGTGAGPGAGIRAAAPATQRPAPAPAPPAQSARPDRYNTLRYANGGDYVSAQQLVNAYASGMSPQEKSQAVLGQLNADRPGFDAAREFEESNLPITKNYVPADGRRVVSNLETRQNEVFRQRLEAVGMQLRTLNDIGNIGGKYLSAGELEELGALRSRLAGEEMELKSVLTASDMNSGHAFSNEAEAIHYIAPRIGLLNMITKDLNPGDDNPESMTEAISRLAGSVASNRPDNPNADLSNAGLLRSAEDMARRSDAIDIRVSIGAAHTGPSGAPSGYFGDRDLTPNNSASAATPPQGANAGAGASPANARAGRSARVADALANASQGAAGAAPRTDATVAQQAAAPVLTQPRQPGGPDYPTAPSRVTRAARQGARNGVWSAGDSFGGAVAAAASATDSAARQPDAVDIARDHIAAESDRVAAAWDRVASQVYYDEAGVLRRIPTPRPGNTYRPDAPRQRQQPVVDPTWRAFEQGGTLTVAELAPIYDGWNIDTAPMGSSGRSLSAAGNSPRIDWHLTSSGDSVMQIAADRANGVLMASAAEGGLHFDYGGVDFASDPVRVNGRAGPAPGSLADILRTTNGSRPSSFDYSGFGFDNPWALQPLASTAHDLAEALYGPLWSDRPYRIRYDPSGREGQFSGGETVASLFDDDIGYLTQLRSNGQGGLGLLLAQPFNILLTWGDGADDLDLHLTGPSGPGSTDRFHVYYVARGSQTVFPFAQLIEDCICRSGSEVILTTKLVQGGVYRISVFNFGDQSASSTVLGSAAANARVQIVRGGVAVPQGDGTTISGGHVIYTGTPPAGQPGNTWVAVEIDPATGRIRAPRAIVQSVNADVVR